MKSLLGCQLEKDRVRIKKIVSLHVAQKIVTKHIEEAYIWRQSWLWLHHRICERLLIIVPLICPLFPFRFSYFSYLKGTLCDLEALILLHCHVWVRQIHVVDGKTMHHHHKWREALIAPACAYRLLSSTPPSYSNRDGSRYGQTFSLFSHFWSPLNRGSRFQFFRFRFRFWDCPVKELDSDSETVHG